jgi:lipoprotein-releasing system permease protein
MDAETFDYRILVAIFAVVLPVSGWFVVVGRRRLTASAARAIFWWVGTAMGLAFLALITVSAQMKEPDFGKFDLGQQIIRGASLGTGVIFVFYTLIALEPLVLDGLEGRTFVSFVSARLMRATKSGFLTVISVLSIAGVAVSSCALCCVTSIMGGFGHDLKRKILDNTAHIVVDTRSPAGFETWKPVLEKVREAAEAHGGAATPVVGGDAMASSATNTAGVLVRGIDPETIGETIKLLDNIEIGKFDYLVHPDQLLELPAEAVIGRGPGGEPYFKGPGFDVPSDLSPELRETLPQNKLLPGVILGRELAKSLHVMVGDELTLLSPMGELGPLGIMPRARKFRVAAIFYSGMYEYDASHAYVLLGVAQKFFDMQTAISRIDVRVPVPEQVDAVRPSVASAVATINAAREGKEDEYEPLRIRDWVEMNRNLFSALALEKVATFIILSIAIAVASFCIICTLLLMVTEKTKEIAVLKSLGASDRGVMGIFMTEGMLIGAFGTILGVVTALAFCLGLSWTGVRLDPDVYYIDRLPVNVDLSDYGMVALAAFGICSLATIYPAFAASRVKPVEGLRYE